MSCNLQFANFDPGFATRSRCGELRPQGLILLWCNDGSLIGLLKSPISVTMLVLTAVVLVGSIYAEVKHKKGVIAGESE